MIEPLDWAVMGVYFAALLGLGFYWWRGQKGKKDYFLGGRNIPSWAIAMSTTATQCGAISMMSIPAFVALASGGGMKWLQLELAVPLGIILVMSLIVPTFYRSKITTAYEYLERRFNPATRSLISFMFLLSRGLATGCAIYAPSFLLSTIIGFPIVYMILLMSVVTMIYTAVGGIKASIYTDVLLFFLLRSRPITDSKGFKLKVRGSLTERPSSKLFLKVSINVGILHSRPIFERILGKRTTTFEGGGDGR